MTDVSQRTGLPNMWSSLRSAANSLGDAEGYTPGLAMRLAQATRAQLAQRGVAEIRDWRELGVSLERRTLSSSGMLIGREFPIRVWVNAQDNWRRQRFTVGHEIAHLLLPSRYRLSPALLEHMCDMYAAELLLPVSLIRRRLSASGSLTSANDVLELANDARINVSPVLYQIARAAWDPNLSIILATSETGCLRVRAGAGPRIGSPPKGQRLSSLGNWRVLYKEETALIRRTGVAKLDYRFIRPSEPGTEESRSGHVHGAARWDSIELFGRRAIVIVNFLEPPKVTLSKRSASNVRVSH